MRFSIRYQLLLPLLAIILGMVAMSGWIAYASAQRARQRIDSNMVHVAGAVKRVAAFLRNPHIISLMKDLSGAEILLVDRQRQPLFDSEGNVLTTLDRVPTQLPEPTPVDTWSGSEQLVTVGTRTYLCRGLAVHPEVQEAYLVYLFLPESLLQEAIEQAVRPGLALGLVFVVASIVLALTLHRQLTRRILQLEERTRLIAQGDFSPMPLPARVDELRDLAQSVNEMAQQLARYQETSKRTERLRLLGQVSGGLAHQLRNSVAGAKLAMQIHARESTEGPSEAIDVALRQLALVEMHLQKFLDLGSATEVRPRPCDLVNLLDEVVLLLRPQCKHSHIELVWKPGDTPVSRTVDPSQLSQAVLNVLSNAIDAAGPDGRVEVLLDVSAPGHTVIEIWDSGAGPSSEVADKLFEPFVTGKKEGVGLGLAVARQILQAHGGDITWQRIRGGTAFRLSIAKTAP